MEAIRFLTPGTIERGIFETGAYLLLILMMAWFLWTMRSMGKTVKENKDSIEDLEKEMTIAKIDIAVSKKSLNEHERRIRNLEKYE